MKVFILQIYLIILSKKKAVCDLKGALEKGHDKKLSILSFILVFFIVYRTLPFFTVYVLPL